MQHLVGKHVPPECVNCPEAESDTCPRRQADRRSARMRRTLIRGTRKMLPVDSILPSGRSLPPDVAVLVPTLDCNMRCAYCFQRDPNSPTGRPPHNNHLSLADWQVVIAELKPLGIPIIVMGGEWSLYHDAIGLLQAIKEAGLALTLITNGTALPRVASELVRLRIERLIVSLDGPAEAHNEARGHPRGYELAVEGIARVIAKRGQCPSPFVQVSCTISPYTQAHLNRFVNAMGTLGVDLVVFNNLIYATAEQVAAQHEVFERLFQVEPLSAHALNHGAHLGIDVALLERELAAIHAGPWSKLTIMSPPGTEGHLDAYYAPHAPPFQSQRCTAVHRELWILPNGEVSACAQISDLTMGNVRQNGVTAAWNSPAYRKFRQQFAYGLLPACARCPKLTYDHPPHGYSSKNCA